MTVIEKENWPRKEHYDFFAPMSDPFYTLTFPVDVTALRRYAKEHRISFYYALVYLVTKSMDAVEAFRYKDRGGSIIRHDRLVPSFTDLKPGGDLFYIVTLDAGDDLLDFCRRAKAESQAQTTLFGPARWALDELVYFTCLPWFPLTALTNEKDVDPSDSVPRVAWGKYVERDGRYELSISLELNHRLLDGVHVGKFYEALCHNIEALEG